MGQEENARYDRATRFCTEAWTSKYPASTPGGISTGYKRGVSNESIPLRAEWLSQQVQESIYELELDASLASDLLSTAPCRVGWREIIEANLE